MDETKSTTAGAARAFYELELAWSIDASIDRLKSWCQEFTEPAFHQYVDQVCKSFYQQARADTEALVRQYRNSPLADSAEAEIEAGSAVDNQILDDGAAQMEALTDVVTRLECHPTVADLQRLLDRSPPPREPLEPSPSRPGETPRQANERLLLDRFRENYAALTYYAREDAAEAFDNVRHHVMTWILGEYDIWADQILCQHHVAPPTTAEAERQSLATALATLDEKLTICRDRLDFVINELWAREQEAGLIGLASIAALIRDQRDGAGSEAEKNAVIEDSRSPSPRRRHAGGPDGRGRPPASAERRRRDPRASSPDGPDHGQASSHYHRGYRHAVARPSRRPRYAAASRRPPQRADRILGPLASSCGVLSDGVPR